MSDNQKLTSVKIDEDLFNDFKVECIKRKFSFQNSVRKSIVIKSKLGI